MKNVNLLTAGKAVVVLQ